MQKIELSVGQAFALHTAVIRELERLRKQAARFKNSRARMASMHYGDTLVCIQRLEALLPTICAAGREEAPAQ